MMKLIFFASLLLLSSCLSNIPTDPKTAGSIIGDDSSSVRGSTKPKMNISSTSTSEAAANGIVNLTVTLSAASKSQITGTFSTIDGTALLGADYVSKTGSLIFAPGELSKSIAISIVNDSIVEPVESFSVGVSNLTGATPGTVGVVTINDDDVAAPDPTPVPTPAPTPPLVSSSTTISHTISNNIFQWSFSCGSGECYSGTFIGGDYWIAPKNPGDEVKLLSVTATGAQSGGLEINPVSLSKQGFLSCKTSYDPVLDFSSSLPKVVTVNSSIVKATVKSTGCQPSGSTCCVDKYGVVTVLPAPPVNNGVEAFRPGMAGTLKRVFYLSDFDLTRIPSLPIVNQTTFAASFNETHTRWHTAYVDHYMWKLGDGARSFAPTGVPDYGATQGMVYLGDLLRAMGTEPISEKRVAITGLIQRGIDLYASYKNGIKWPTGAGQQAGRKPAVTFFASLLRADDAIKTEIRGIAANNGNDFHEDGQVQVYATKGNTPIWGDPCNENTYWAQLFYAQKYDGGSNVQIGSGDNSRTCGDPHGYIDGPAGYPGTFYMACCSTGEFISYQLAQSLMPDYCSAANDPHLSIYTRRILNEGLHSQPDPCAPPDPRENLNCAAYAAGAPNCLYYKKTWGPDPAKPGDCIRNGVGQNGRHPGAHGTFIPAILNESLISKKLREMQGNSILNGCNL